MEHLFRDYIFGKAVRQDVSFRYGISLPWEDCSLMDFLSRWLKSRTKPLYLPILCSWLILKARNDAIFHDLRPRVHSVKLGVIRLISYFSKSDRVIKHRRTGRAPEVSPTTGFFMVLRLVVMAMSEWFYLSVRLTLFT